MSELDRTVRMRVNLGRAIITETKSVDGQEPDNAGNIALYATHIPVSSAQNAQTISEALTDLQDISAADIEYDPESDSGDSVKDVVDDLITDLTQAEMEEIMDEIFGGEEA